MKNFLISILLILCVPLFAMGKKEGNIETVTVWHSNTGSIGDAFDDLVDDFNSTIGIEKGIRIESVFQGSANDVLTKVKAASNGNLPDIAELDASACFDMKNASYVVTIDELGASTEDILNNALLAFDTDIGILAMPFNCSALVLYYNKTVFDSLGIEPPKTLDEFAEVSKILGIADSSGKVLRSAFVGVPTTYELGAFIGSQNGLSYVVDGKNGHFGTLTDTVFDKEGTFRNFLEHWKRFYDSGFVSDMVSGTTEEFVSGRSLSMLKSSSNLRSILDLIAGRFELGIAPVPMVDENATGGVNIGGGALFSFSDRDAVRIVIEYFTSPEAQLKWSINTGYIPINTKTLESDEYLEFVEANPLFSVPVEEILSSNPEVTGIWIPGAYQIYYSFQSTIRDVLEKGKSIEEADREMAEIIRRAIDGYSGNIDKY